MKHYSPLAWMMAIAIAGTVTTACSLDGYEPEKPFTTDPVEKTTLFAIGIGEPGTRSYADAEGVLFTDNDIEWFDPVTRELRFRDTMEPLREKIPLTTEIDFYLGGEFLFLAALLTSVSSVARCSTTSYSVAERLTTRSSTMAATISTTAIPLSLPTMSVRRPIASAAPRNGRRS